MDSLRQIAQWDKVAAKVTYLIFVGLSNVQKEYIVVRIEVALEIFHLDLRHCGVAGTVDSSPRIPQNSL